MSRVSIGTNTTSDRGISLSIDTNVTLPVKSAERRVDDYGFYLDSVDANSPAPPQSQTRREMEVVSVLENWPAKRTKLKKLCRGGIPHSLRARFWYSLSDAAQLKQEGLFSVFISQARVWRIHLKYLPFLKSLSVTFIDAIQVFKGMGQIQLRTVLRVYALYNPVIGYCQGMGMIAGLLLMLMPPEDSFWILVSILKDHVKDYHSTNLYSLRVDSAVFEILLNKHASAIGKHMAKYQVPPVTYTAQWFLPLFTMSLPWPTVLRVWDMFLCDGTKALFRADYLLKECQGTPETITCVLKVPREFLLPPQKFIDACVRIKITHADVEKCRNRVKSIRPSLEELDAT